MEAIKITRQLEKTYADKRISFMKERDALKTDIEMCNKKLADNPSDFFQSKVLPKWKGEIETLDKKIIEMKTYEDTISVFSGKNREMLSGTDVDWGKVMHQESLCFDAEAKEFWRELDSFLEERF